MERRKPLRADPDKTREWQQRSRKPLKTNTPLQSRGAGLGRGVRSAVGKAQTKRTLTPDPVTTATREAVRRRSGGFCEARASTRCTGAAAHVHHRKLRRHGDHRPENLLAVCVSCHTQIHARPDWSYAHGYLVRAGDDPAAVPVLAATYGRGVQ